MEISQDIKKEIENSRINGKSIIRSDGNINSPLVERFRRLDLYQRIVDVTSFLPVTAPFSQRWWHIKNDLFEYRKCYCGSPITTWRRKYCRFCSNICACKSDEAKERTRRMFTGIKHTEEQNRAKSVRCIGKKFSEETKNKFRLKKIGALNPRYGKIPWNKGLFGPLNPSFGKKRPGAMMKKGKDNFMYGKSPSFKTGAGIYGKFNGVHFRSSLELFYLMYWYENKIRVESAEQELYRITYCNNGLHTYTPDFFLEDKNTLVEIKPEKMQEDDITLKKFETLKASFDSMNCELLGFCDIGSYIVDAIYTEKINMYLGYELIIEERQLLRLRKTMGI